MRAARGGPRCGQLSPSGVHVTRILSLAYMRPRYRVTRVVRVIDKRDQELRYGPNINGLESLPQVHLLNLMIFMFIRARLNLCCIR